MKSLRIRLVRSPIGAKPSLRRTVTALGLRRVGSTVVLAANPAVHGMVRAVSHLLDVQEVEAAGAGAAKRASRRPAAQKPPARKPKE